MKCGDPTFENILLCGDTSTRTTPGSKFRQPRPHSSPVRSPGKKKRRSRSRFQSYMPPPKTQPPPHFLSSPPVPTDIQLQNLLFESIRHRKLNDCGEPIMSGLSSVTTGYYASKPPAMPLLLVPYRDVKTHIKNSEKNAQVLSTVRSILSELIDQMPLNLKPPTVPSAKPPSAALHQSSSYSRLPSVTGLSGVSSIRCNVATQAQSSQSEEYQRCTCSTENLTGNADEWLGGVRALRDSHVRLVLRQLRHIDRLNRALDRVLNTPSHSSSLHTSVSHTAR